MRPYDLRHSAATLLLAAGEHPKIVAELLGDSQIALTLDTYSQVTHARAGGTENGGDRCPAAAGSFNGPMNAGCRPCLPGGGEGRHA
jgi:hypothetical protein